MHATACVYIISPTGRMCLLWLLCSVYVTLPGNDIFFSFQLTVFQCKCVRRRAYISSPQQEACTCSGCSALYTYFFFHLANFVEEIKSSRERKKIRDGFCTIDFKQQKRVLYLRNSIKTKVKRINQTKKISLYLFQNATVFILFVKTLV